jgi:hypothetical protein
LTPHSDCIGRHAAFTRGGLEPPVFEPMKEETEARKRLGERCRECGLDVLLPFVPLVERSLLRDRQPLQPLRGVGGRMVLATSRDARALGR